jgi:hypothetical protein
VKRDSGDNSWGVAPCEDSSLPGLILKRERDLVPMRAGSLSPLRAGLLLIGCVRALNCNVKQSSTEWNGDS